MTNNISIKHLIKADPILSNIISSIDLPEIESTQNVFHDLISCIIEQQIHYRSSKKIFYKMLIASKLEILSPLNFIQFEEKGIIGYKLSLSKYETLNRILDFWNTYPDLNWQQLTDKEIRNKLSEIKGIGPWTMDMILLYTLQRPNIFPVDDFHLKEIMVNLYHLNPITKLKAQMLNVAEPWAEHKSLAVRYLLAWKSFNKKR